jgi:acyl carrier protein
MVHAFMGDDKAAVKDLVRQPFTRYLASAVDLIRNFARNANLPIDFETMTPKDLDDLLAFAFDRYFDTSALFGTVTSCGAMIERLVAAGVNEVACLIDFGVPNRDALNGLTYINALKNAWAATSPQSTPRSIADLASTYKPTLMQCTPAILQLIRAGRDDLEALRSLRTLMIGGESLPPTLAREIKDALSCRLVNMYGPTETTVWSSTGEVSQTDVIDIGTPIGNTTMYILTKDSGLPAPPGVVGELYIGGQGVTRGYLNHPELTAERFVPDPFAAKSGQRLYRTGDLARFLPDGRIQLLGRDDQQVKVRGVRIELGEIESALCEHESIDRAIVVAKRSKADGDIQLVAYAVAANKDAPPVPALRGFLKDRLPEVMIPSRFVFLDKFPLTTSGKVARDLLPEPAADLPVKVAPITLARGHEVTIGSIWKRVLEIESFGPDDNFFDLGGHSLRLVQVHGELSRLLDRDIPLVKLLEHPTVRSLAAYLDSAGIVNGDQKHTVRAANQRAAILQQQRKNSGAAAVATGA